MIPRTLRLIGRAAVNVVADYCSMIRDTSILAVLPPMRAADDYLRAHSPERVEPAAAPSPGPIPSSATAGPGDTLTCWSCDTPDDMRGHPHWVLRPTD